MSDFKVHVIEFSEENYALVWDEECRCDVLSPTNWWAVCDINDHQEMMTWLKIFCPTAHVIWDYTNTLTFREPGFRRALVSLTKAKEAAAFKLAWYGS